MTITVYHYAGCSTCCKARKFLDARGLEVALVDLTVITSEGQAAGRVASDAALRY